MAEGTLGLAPGLVVEEEAVLVALILVGVESIGDFIHSDILIVIWDPQVMETTWRFQVGAVVAHSKSALERTQVGLTHRGRSALQQHLGD